VVRLVQSGLCGKPVRRALDVTREVLLRRVAAGPPAQPVDRLRCPRVGRGVHFPDGDTYLNSIYDGASGHTRQYWSLAWLPGERYLDRPVYVLTSELTFSGAEEFCYNLKAQHRAVLIGETTRGGAHPTEAFPITPTFEITVPIARSVNPVTGGNWEGTGVAPDRVTSADEAFDVAYREALQHVLSSSTSPAVLAEARAALG
jgi:hypothetical protein